MEKPIDLLKGYLNTMIQEREELTAKYAKGEIDFPFYMGKLDSYTLSIEHYRYIIRVIETYA